MLSKLVVEVGGWFGAFFAVCGAFAHIVARAKGTRQSSRRLRCALSVANSPGGGYGFRAQQPAIVVVLALAFLRSYPPAHRHG